MTSSASHVKTSQISAGASGLHRVQQRRERRQLHGLRQRLRQPTRCQDRDPERDENDRQLGGVVDDEHVRREPAEYRVAELGDALEIEDFAHVEKLRIDSTSRGV